MILHNHRHNNLENYLTAIFNVGFFNVMFFSSNFDVENTTPTAVLPGSLMSHWMSDVEVSR